MIAIMHLSSNVINIQCCFEWRCVRLAVLASLEEGQVLAHEAFKKGRVDGNSTRKLAVANKLLGTALAVLYAGVHF
eukprot:1212064-Amphidinium_carterae.1